MLSPLGPAFSLPCAITSVFRSATDRGRGGGRAERHGDECSFVGLSRQAELDILPDGGFSELELVCGLGEIAATLPDEATFIEHGVVHRLDDRTDAATHEPAGN